MTCLQSVEKNAESLRSTPKNGAGEGRFDASCKRHPVTESSYINSLANSPYRSTVKTLPATLPEPWAVIRGQSSEVQASRLPPRGRRTGVTWAGCEISIELGRGGGGICSGCLRLGPRTGDGWVDAGTFEIALRICPDLTPLLIKTMILLLS